MVTVVSSLTGQALFTMELQDGVVTMHPTDVRRMLSLIQESGLGDNVVLRSQPGAAPVPASCFLGGAALRDPRIHVGGDFSSSNFANLEA